MASGNEFRVRPVTRYVVTQFEYEDHGDGTSSGGSYSYGEFGNLSSAEKVGLALCKAHEGSTFQTLENSPLRDDLTINWSDGPR